MDEKKKVELTKEEQEQIKNLRDKMNFLAVEYGRNAMEQKYVTEVLGKLDEEYTNLRNEETKLMTNLKEKYGDEFSLLDL